MEKQKIMNHYKYHILLVLIISSIVLLVNILVFNSGDTADYLYIFDLTYVAGNSTHFVALSLSDKGVEIKDEK